MFYGMLSSAFIYAQQFIACTLVWSLPDCGCYCWLFSVLHLKCASLIYFYIWFCFKSCFDEYCIVNLSKCTWHCVLHLKNKKKLKVLKSDRQIPATRQVLLLEPAKNPAGFENPQKAGLRVQKGHLYLSCYIYFIGTYFKVLCLYFTPTIQSALPLHDCTPR